MKKCEIFSNLRVPCGSNIVIRADGRRFHRLASSLNLQKPYDQRFVECMVASSIDFFKEFNARIIYTFSDEINILLADLPFGGRIEKLDSVFASYISSSFTREVIKKLAKDVMVPSISFDCRLIPLDQETLVDYFRSRQDEAWRNCLNSYAYWILRQEMGKEKAIETLQGVKGKEIHEILFQRGLNITDVPSWQRRGVALYKEKVDIEGYNPLDGEDTITTRMKIREDWELPLFDKTFFKKYSIL